MKILKRTVITLYVATIGVLVCSTFVQQAWGADYAARHIYGAAWFFALWATLAVTATLYMARRRLYKQPVPSLFHFSLLIILLGGAFTHFSGRTGQLHLRQGHSVSAFLSSTGRSEALPFAVRLDSFSIDYYPGTQAPRNFVSRLTVTDRDGSRRAEVSMNNIYSLRGFRLYQSSFDADLRGSVLSVNYDPWGIAITYAGYALLALAVVLLLVVRGGPFRRLLSAPALRRGLFVAVVVCGALPAAARSVPTINESKAKQVARYQVVYNDRVVPLGTVATDFVKKIYGRPSYRGLSAEQVVYGWLLRPQVWQNEPMLLIKNRALRRRLGLEGRYATLASLFDAGGRYKLLDMEPEAQSNTAMGKALRELDEKVGLILMLSERELFTPLPASAPRLSSARVEAELFYNRVPFARILFMVNLAAGVLCFFFLFVGPRYRRVALRCGGVVLWLAFVFALCGYALRWYVGGRVPLSNGYETMLLLALLLMGLTVALWRRFAFVLPFGFLLSGLSLLVAHLGQMNPQITPLMPVLHSPLLSLHVGLIMAAYALLAFTLLCALFALLPVGRGHAAQAAAWGEQLTALSRLLLVPAVGLLAVGIFLGAVWANVSWGRYWSWDPKETWALITLLIYAVPLHTASLPRLARPRAYHLYMIFAFLSVLMTYFGVNYLMSGMHSYA